MNKREKALLRFAADNLDKRAKNCAPMPNKPPDWAAEDRGKACAYATAADYLRGLADGFERMPLMRDLGEQKP